MDDNVKQFPDRKAEVAANNNEAIFGVDTPMYNVIDVRWYSNKRIQVTNEPIGIVLVEEPHSHKVFAVIGNGKDPQQIAAWGTHIPRQMAEGIFDYQMPDYKEYN